MITIGFSSHHVETLPFIREHMEQHEVIVLEEPRSANLEDMLRGSVTINDYLMELDSGFPEFERRMCELLRELASGGRKILQVEPYLEKLITIHELFAGGKKPEDVMGIPELEEVYQAEKNATGALISYYSRSMSAPFNMVVDGVKDFARADAKRLTLRERLRAKAIVELGQRDQSMYVEAGYIHYPLYHYLRKHEACQKGIRLVFLLTPIIKKLKAKRRNLGPGDILTLHYAFHNGLPEELANLLAARSLIFIKLIHKEELLPGDSEAPHAEDIAQVNRLVEGLRFHECGELFDQIRLAKRERAVQLAWAYVARRRILGSNLYS